MSPGPGLVSESEQSASDGVMQMLKKLGALGFGAAIISTLVVASSQGAGAQNALRDNEGSSPNGSSDVITGAYERSAYDLVGATLNLEPPICYSFDHLQLVVIPTPDFGMRVAVRHVFDSDTQLDGPIGVGTSSGVPVVDIAPTAEAGRYDYEARSSDGSVEFSLVSDRGNVAFEPHSFATQAEDVKLDAGQKSGVSCVPFD